VCSLAGSRYKEPLTLDSAIAVLHEVITKEAPGKRVVVAGFSMGGYVTAAYAAAHPEVMAGALLGACAHDTHTRSWRMMGNVADFVYKVCSAAARPDCRAAEATGVVACIRMCTGLASCITR
jgi:pimeloyl-ACP methyl ester carboxylesterase